VRGFVSPLKAGNLISKVAVKVGMGVSVYSYHEDSVFNVTLCSRWM